MATRKKTPEADVITAPAPVVTELVEAIPAEPSPHHETLDLGVALGKIQALSGISALADTAALNVFDSIRENKAWRQLRKPDGSEYESIKEVCAAHIGLSYRRLAQLSDNRNMVGNDAYEYAHEIGLRQLDFDAIKRMPEEQQAAIKNALSNKAAPPEIQAVLKQALAEASKAKEQADAAIKQKANLEKDLESSRERLKGKSEDLDNLVATLRIKTREADTARQFLETATVSEQQKAIQAQITTLVSELQARIGTSLRSGLEQLRKLAQDDGLNNATMDTYISAQLDTLSAEINLVRGDLNVSEGVINPHWRSEEAKTLAEMRAVKG